MLCGGGKTASISSALRFALKGKVAMGMQPIHVLVVENGQGDAAPLEQQLTDADVASFALERITRSQITSTRLERNHVDVVLLHLSPEQALEVLPHVQEQSPAVPVVVLSDHENESAAVQAVRGGAQDYLVRSKTDGRTLAHGLRYAIERKRAEEALQKSEAFYHSLVESLPQNIFRKDLLGRFTFANRRFCNGIGKPLEEIVGRTDANFFPPELADKYRTDDLGVIETGKTFDTVEKYVNSESETLYVQVIKTPVYDASGKLIGTQGIFWDITERVRNEEYLRKAYLELASKETALLDTMERLKLSHEELIQAQLQLIQAEKLESVGRLAAGVAHEVKNPLAILLMGLTYLAEGNQRDPSADQEVMRAMREAISRANLIVRGLVDFSAHRELDVIPEDLNAMIRRSLILVKHEITSSHTTVITELDDSLPKVLLDPNRIQQVFVNLFMNAVQAMPPNGTLAVRTYCRSHGDMTMQDRSIPRDRCKPGDTTVVAEVEDSGPGVPPEKLSKVFDPFFTTKPAGRGTGLGLTVVRKIIELHDGFVSISNRYDDESGIGNCRGARVTVTFKAFRSDNHEHDNAEHTQTHPDRG
jgi:PAS domain S-box-containing protein